MTCTRLIYVNVPTFTCIHTQAKQMIESAGGTAKLGYYNKLGMRALLKPERFDTIPRRAAPPPRSSLVCVMKDERTV